jgi:hypothetical protein
MPKDCNHEPHLKAKAEVLEQVEKFVNEFRKA